MASVQEIRLVVAEAIRDGWAVLSLNPDEPYSDVARQSGRVAAVAPTLRAGSEGIVGGSQR
jgi:hypothetical protein